MIEYKVLRKVVFEVLRNHPRTNFTVIIPKVGELAASADTFPTEEDCPKKGIDYSYYEQRRLNPNDELNVSQIIWDLIVDRVLTMGSDRANLEWLRLTEFGNAVVSSEVPGHYDPEDYLASLESFAPKLDPVIRQYVIEGLNSYRQRLFSLPLLCPVRPLRRLSCFSGGRMLSRLNRPAIMMVQRVNFGKSSPMTRPSRVRRTNWRP